VNAQSDTAEHLESPLATPTFDALFEAHYEPIARAIVRIVQDRGRAEELAVEAFWKLLKNPQAQGRSAGGWLHRTAVRLALDELRRRARQSRYERLLGWIPLSRSRTPHELFSASQEQGRVRSVLAALPDRQAELLLLRHEGASYDELASSLDIHPASVGTLLSRAQQAFRKEYVQRYGEPHE
jgi:RNA polymerase sigma-70 factor (ECF subfamily)